MKIYQDWFRVDHIKLKPQQIVKTPDEYSWIFDFVKMKKCYDNCFDLCIKIPDSAIIFGYLVSSIPLEHAWLMLPEGILIDPTFEKYNFVGEKYYSVIQINSTDLIEENQLLTNNEYVPSHYDVRKSKKYRHLFI